MLCPDCVQAAEASGSHHIPDHTHNNHWGRFDNCHSLQTKGMQDKLMTSSAHRQPGCGWSALQAGLQKVALLCLVQAPAVHAAMQLSTTIF